MFGFLCLAGALFYSSRLSPQIDFDTLVGMRMAQSFGLAFLFVPISALAYATLPNEQNGDATALFTMFRNVAGSIGIAVSTALATQWTQVHTAYLVGHLTAFDQPFLATVQARAGALITLGRAPAEATHAATNTMFQTLHQQAQVLAYSDVFLFCAVLAIGVAPCALLFSAARASGGPAGE